MASAAQAYFTIDERFVARCRDCNEQIYWQTGRRSGKRYPTNVYVQDKEFVTNRVNFHHCDPAAKAAWQKQKLQASGQQQMDFDAKRVNVVGVNKLFDTAVAAGLRYPKIRLQVASGQRVVLARAGEQSRYKGQVMVTDGERFGQNKFFGRVDLDGIFQAGRDAKTEVEKLLEQLGSDPASVASAYGRLTGNCCFCGRALDDPRSVSVGYGPVCAEKFGLPWGTVTVPQPPKQPQPVQPSTQGPWTRFTNGAGQPARYTAEASDFQAVGCNQHVNIPMCPVCGKQTEYAAGQNTDGKLYPVKDSEGDLLFYTGFCSCGTELTIYND